MKKSMIYRVLIYIAGLLILAMGLTLNTKAGLGVSPIISVSYSVSEITHHNFGNTTLVLYGKSSMKKGWKSHFGRQKTARKIY